MDISVSVKSAFFDPSRVLNQVERQKVRLLMRFGAFVRARAKSSIGRRKAISMPGSPPSGHTGALRSSILFAYDPSAKSVVIGPVRYGGRGQGARALEEGGAQVVPGLRKGRTLTYQARPFMLPAFRHELRNALDIFKGMIH